MPSTRNLVIRPKLYDASHEPITTPKNLFENQLKSWSVIVIWNADVKKKLSGCIFTFKLVLGSIKLCYAS